MIRDMEIQKEVAELKAKTKREVTQFKCDKQIELEILKHKNIMEEIEALKKGKINSFGREK